jgi:hypothetical protein
MSLCFGEATPLPPPKAYAYEHGGQALGCAPRQRRIGILTDGLHFAVDVKETFHLPWCLC